MAPTTLDEKATAQEAEDFKEATRHETEDSLHMECDKLLKTSKYEDLPRWKQEFEGFQRLFSRSMQMKPHVDWPKVEPLPAGAIRPYDQLPHPDPTKIKELLDKLVVVKLNGGLGTSMGCKGPKSLISVRNDLTFLDLTIQQIQNLNYKYESNVPLVLMNSFNTDDDTQKILRKYRNVHVDMHSFNQSRYPRIHKESLMPIATNLQSEDLEAWYPPGHGNFYEAFSNSGLLDNFINAGKEYCFVSNIDNMGATVDLNILNFLMRELSQQPQFVMEVTDKTRADVKGGTLISYEGKLTLLEIAQVPKDFQDEFKSVNKFRQYGLILKKPSTKVTLDSLARKQNIFGDSDDDEKESSPKPKKMSVSESRIKKQTQMQHERALAEDPTVFEYDKVYEQIEEKRNEKVESQKKADKTREPKYVPNLLKVAKQRELDFHAREERKQQKERIKEAGEFEDKEVFVTGAYRKQMEEVEKHRLEQERMDAIDARMDVMKQKDLSGFHRHLLNDITREGQSIKQEPKEEEKLTEIDKPTTEQSSKQSRQKTYRRRRHTSGSDEDSDRSEENERNTKQNEKKSIYSDSDHNEDNDDNEQTGGLRQIARKSRNQKEAGLTRAEKQRRFFTPTPPSSPEPDNRKDKQVKERTNDDRNAAKRMKEGEKLSEPKRSPNRKERHSSKNKE